MIDVGGKAATRRRALARGTIELSPAAFAAVRDGQNPKGDVLALAEIAGIQAVKRTSEWIPLCHPLPIEHAQVWFEMSGEREIAAFCEVSCEAKTGVEMEALCGVQGALLTIYDLSKAVDPAITIRETRLIVKEGGKHGIWRHPDEGSAPPPRTESARPELEGCAAAVATLSDRASSGRSEDRSGPLLAGLLHEAGADVRAQELLPDDEDRIVSLIRGLALEKRVDLILLTGGTGLGPRDRTPEALIRACPRLIAGFGELLRSEGARHTPLSWLSRSVAGVLDRTVVVALPGSPKSVQECFATLLPLLSHAIEIARGGDHG